ncbi:MAG: basic amino acid ABC transporter substrate-binding protein [Thermincolia bacterium]
MKKYLKSVLSVMLVLGLALALVGCGGKQTTSTEGEKKTEETAKKKYVFASDTAYAPFEFQDKDGKYVGFDMDLIDAIAKAAGFEYEIKSLNFDGVLAAVQSGNVDGAISAITIKPERAEKFDFSEPYFEANQSIAVKVDNDAIKSLADLKGKVIAVQIGTTGAMEAAKVEGVTVKTFNNIPEAFLELKNGGADAVMNDIPVTAEYIKKNADVKVAFEIPTGEKYGIGVNKGNKELLEKINQGLKAVKENGEYDKIYEKWFGAKK